MGKSTYPAKYLERASQILKLAYEVGIDVKVNILLYAGETSRTIDETVTWLDIHRKYITGVSVGPVIAFGWEKKKKEFVTSLEALGARICNSNDIVGVTQIDLSSQISGKESLKISKQISQEFMTHEEYFKLKSFSYFSRDYTFSDFEDDIKYENGLYSFSHNL